MPRTGAARWTSAAEPLGVLTHQSLITVTRSAANAVAEADLIALHARLLPPSDPAAVCWAAHLTAWRKMAAGASHLMAYVADPHTGSVHPYCLGHRVFVTDKLPTLNTVGDVLLLDRARYLIGDLGRIEVAVSGEQPDGFIKNQSLWRLVARGTGMPWLRDKVTIASGDTLSPFVALAAG